MEGLGQVIAANACSLCACISDSVSGAQKKRSRMLAVQMISQVFYAAGSIILGGYSSTAQNVVAVLRNLAAIKSLKHKVIEWILIALGVALGIVGIVLNHNANGWLDWLPIVGNLEYSIAVFRFRNNDRALKCAFILNMVFFAVFNFAIRNYIGGGSCVVVAVTTLIALLRSLRKTDEQPPVDPAGGEE